MTFMPLDQMRPDVGSTVHGIVTRIVPSTFSTG
jgi:hypothetical protein